MDKKNLVCDPDTGLCTPADLSETAVERPKESDKEIIYVGDPMCSWGWGISNHLKELKSHYPQYKFSLVMGGLRPGGGDDWDQDFKDYLMHHWDEVTKRSGQPFGYDLFERESFNYDTEPPCRAVVTAKKWLGEDALDFYEAVSRKFYVDNDDPGKLEFYQSICERFEIPFSEFTKDFNSDELKHKTHQEFLLNRQWGVKGYPTVLFKSNDELYQINRGYEEFERMNSVIENILTEESATSE